MKEFIEALTSVAKEYTGKEGIRFILKKSSGIAIFKSFTKNVWELYVHIPGKNIQCFSVSETLLSAIDSEKKDSIMKNLFYKETLKWIDSGKFREVLNGLQME